MLTQSDSALSIAEQQDLIQTTDNHAVEAAIKHVIDSNAAEVARYKNGEKQLIGFFMGQFMKASGGKVDPKTANQALRNALEL
jgi:aspartyl-tRNA(Asn)/glutamyl-tRNA(Gln) amidotransferase subunit B